jgi:hypothetical protein
MLGLEGGQGPATGVWQRDYDKEEALRVHGGVEVRHPNGYRPHAPDYLMMYIGKNGVNTSDPALAVMENDEPVLTEDYKKWMDIKLSGGRLDGAARSDLQVTGTFAKGDPGGF